MSTQVQTEIPSLTGREMDVLRCLVEGLSNQESADRLVLALTTVKWYNTQIYEKLGVSNREEAISRAEELGLFAHSSAQPPQSQSLLPAQTTPFIGRRDEVHEVSDLLRLADVPIVTLLAPGGMGKTRLALAVAEQLLAEFDDAAFVGLASVREPQYVLGAITEALHAPVDAEDPDIRAQLFAYLENQRLLLVMDNFEHLLAAAGLVMEIVQAAPSVKILVTSRERLNLSGETVYSLGGMRFPAWETPEDALNYDAVRLFMQSARRVRADFELHPEDLNYLARICRLTEGMPLAIELAAGWVDVLTLEQIADEISQGIDILETELRDVPERHRSIRAAIDYSWKGLDATERDVLMKLSVFRGGFDAESAAVVTGASLRTLRKLVNKALVTALVGARYNIHELLRQYAADQLRQSSQAEQTRQRHAEYFATYCERLLLAILNGNVERLREADGHWDNMVAAWHSLLETLDLAGIERACAGFASYIGQRGRHHDGYELFAKALARIEQAPQSGHQQRLLGRLLTLYGEMVVAMRPYDAREYLLRAIEVLEPLGPSRTLSEAYGIAVDYFDALRLNDDDLYAFVQKALALAREVNDSYRITSSLEALAYMYMMRGDLERAQDYTEQALQVAAQNEIIPYQVWSLEALQADLAQQRGDYELAYKWAMRNVANADAMKNMYHIGRWRGMLCEIAIQQNKLADAAYHAYEFLRQHHLYAYDWQTLGAIYGIALQYFANLGEYTRMLELLGFVRHHPLSVHKTRVESRLGELHDRLLEVVSADQIAEASERGRGWQLEQVVQGLLDELAERASINGEK